ncbi:TetR/AcrR family transcriptional regulator [Intestinibacter bartlettii]|uniref:TetR/AcrR family transcriptional regulator n=1 Tax=Intestinibacter bartlettii TaxID=261299 RepID=UPI001D1163F3|nr:TetR/AcrR family transcriptional regulator [Intestinibacter bartlettii]MCC2706541.1 TetR/AcrR family transcriptional regulator [Intestinibacter bartlettii]MCC2761881.1 TetR/AcrR family transcriptional regulator [Intestinibacter bartlettii]MDU6473592.1 helix-turn-helix domain-containing protein [Intestinibacter bartlettii]
MCTTKEKILLTSLKLFAQDGYEAVSISKISGELGMAKSALYKHYKNKRDIFDSIINRMDELDYERAREYNMPDGNMDEIIKGYREISIDKIRIYTEAQFKHWTEEEFPSLFRRMLTLEQYRNQEMADLYQKYLVSGPIDYMTYLFAGITGKKEEAKQLAIEFYGPIFLMYSLYDNKREEDDLAEMLKKHVDRFSKKMDSY